MFKSVGIRFYLLTEDIGIIFAKMSAKQEGSDQYLWAKMWLAATIAGVIFRPTWIRSLFVPRTLNAKSHLEARNVAIHEPQKATTQRLEDEELKT